MYSKSMAATEGMRGKQGVCKRYMGDTEKFLQSLWRNTVTSTISSVPRKTIKLLCPDSSKKYWRMIK